MSNMSYCMFTNTLQYLRDCYEAMDSDDLSDEEKEARGALVRLCDAIANDYADDGDVYL